MRADGQSTSGCGRVRQPDRAVRRPVTWDRWRAALVALTKDRNRDGTPEQYGMALPYHTGVPVWPILLWAHGGDVVETDGAKSALTRPRTVSAVSTWTSLVTQNRISPVGLSGAEAEQLFKEGKAAMTITGPWAVPGFQDAGVDFGLVPVPPGTARQVTLGFTTSLALNAELTPQKAAAAHRFMSYWMEEDTQRRWMEESGDPSIRVDRTTPVTNPLGAQFAEDTRFAEPLMPGVVDFSLVYDDVFEPAIRRIATGEVNPENGLLAAAAWIDHLLSQSG
ncbi:extracellular solute-binding protein [Saccharothrix saharensis]|uniref:extracellular solute-binding protein n=1 Tax=Saccharothrix saharensis TaxID=571190 RepID=UPI00368931F1